MKRQGLTIAMAVAALPLLAAPAPTFAQGWGNGACRCTATPSRPLTADEVKWLKFMREEEKLARDIYRQMLGKWNLIVFRNIAESEERHFTAVGNLLTCYKVSDPSANAAPGVFSDPRLAALYNELLAQGLRSVKDAVEVGIVIEKTDIADLEAALKVTDMIDIKRVYSNLLNASFNHLEAFETNLEMIGSTTGGRGPGR